MSANEVWMWHPTCAVIVMMFKLPNQQNSLLLTLVSFKEEVGRVALYGYININVFITLLYDGYLV